MSAFQAEFLKNLNKEQKQLSASSHNPKRSSKQSTQLDSFPINVERIMMLNSSASNSSQSPITPGTSSLGKRAGETMDASSIVDSEVWSDSVVQPSTPIRGTLEKRRKAVEIVTSTPETPRTDQNDLSLILEKLANIENIEIRKEKIDSKLLEVSIKNKNKLSRLEKDMAAVTQDLLEIKRSRGPRNENILPITSEAHFQEIQDNFEEYKESLHTLFYETRSANAFRLYRHFLDQMLPNLPRFNMSGKKAPNANNKEITPQAADDWKIFNLLLSVGITKYNLDIKLGRSEMVRAFKSYYDCVRLQALKAKKLAEAKQLAEANSE